MIRKAREKKNRNQIEGWYPMKVKRIITLRRMILFLLSGRCSEGGDLWRFVKAAPWRVVQEQDSCWFQCETLAQSYVVATYGTAFQNSKINVLSMICKSNCLYLQFLRVSIGSVKECKKPIWPERSGLFYFSRKEDQFVKQILKVFRA